jgi:hypothetical protein
MRCETTKEKKMRGKRITLTNDFHNTRVFVTVPSSGILSHSQFLRIKRKLCGRKECGCGVIRGPQEGDFEIEVDWNNDGQTIYTVTPLD